MSSVNHGKRLKPINPIVEVSSHRKNDKQESVSSAEKYLRKIETIRRDCFLAKGDMKKLETDAIEIYIDMCSDGTYIDQVLERHSGKGTRACNMAICMRAISDIYINMISDIKSLRSGRKIKVPEHIVTSGILDDGRTRSAKKNILIG